MTDAGIPFRNLTVAESDRVLDMIRAGATPARLVHVAPHVGLMPSEVRGFVERNPEAVARAKARRPA